MSSNAEAAQEPGPIGGRYRVEAELGRGGTARVYRVLDERSGERLALKQLVAPSERSANLQIMFEREYHTLAQLAHPRIVRVFDYGLDQGSPYYTMELLQGGDARTALRNEEVDVRRACVLLRDVASALALIHSRRLVHRDISPRNLWCMPDQRGKLIDFGTLVAMGPQTRIAGTPPFVAPESVYVQPLEARSDLYSLGALAYFMLTKRNAYPAREIGDLRELWQRTPVRPEQIRPDLPPALCDLVMSLLSLDLRGRPASAAEVAERLSAIGELPADDESSAAQAFLTSPQLIARGDASSRLRKRLLRAMRGRGGIAAIVAPSGLGRSRMLDSFVLEAKLAGAAVVPLFASAVGSGPFSLCAALAERLLEAMPMLAAALLDSAGVLGHLSPAVHRALGSPALVELTAQERSQRLTAALVKLVETASNRQTLLIAVDDAHRVDGASLGVLGRLSLLAGERSLVLVTTVEAGTLADPPPALEQLAFTRDRIELEPLGGDDTRALLASLFGLSVGLDDAASWLHELSQGSPAACMQYAQYLVDQGIAHFEHGRWELPTRLRDRGLPATLDAMFEARIARLSADARTLLLGLALARDDSRSTWQPETHVRIEDFPKLLDDGDSARVFAALDELLQAGVLQQRDSYYVLAQRALVDVLLRTADRSERQSAHRRLAVVFQQPGYGGFLGVRQLQRAGEGVRAREAMQTGMTRLASNMDWGAMRLSVTAECTQQALADWEREHGSPHEGITLRRMLLLICSVYDWSFAQLGAAQIAQLQADCGLDHWAQTDATQPDITRVIECLKFAQQRYDATAEPERGFAPGDAVRELAALTLPLSGAAVHSHDVALARSLPGVLEPLRPLSPLIAMLGDQCVVGVERATGREIGIKLLAAVETMLAATSLPEVLRLGAAVVTLHIQTIEDARCGRERALELSDRIAVAAGDDMFLACHARWLANAFRGDAARAQRHRRQVEVITEDDVWRRKCFLFAEAELGILTGDLIGLRRTSEAIAQLAATFPGWRPWLGFARAGLHRLLGDLDEARAELDAALALAPAGEHRAYTRVAPARAELLLQLNDAAGALGACDEIHAAIERFGLDLSTEVAVRRIRALAHSARGAHDLARASLEHAFELAHEQQYGGLPLALLHEARARVAIAARAGDECSAALEILRAAIELADAPARVQAYEALREESGRQLSAEELPAALTSSTAVPTETSTAYSEVRTRMSSCTERHERARQALDLLLEDSGAPAGHLFLFDASGLFAAASHPGFAGEKLLRVAQQYLASQREETRTAVVETANLGPIARRSLAPGDGETQLVPALISEQVDGQRMLTGVALLGIRDGAVRMPRDVLVQAISRCLLAAGDSIPLAIDD